MLADRGSTFTGCGLLGTRIPSNGQQRVGGAASLYGHARRPLLLNCEGGSEYYHGHYAREEAVSCQ